MGGDAATGSRIRRASGVAQLVARTVRVGRSPVHPGAPMARVSRTGRGASAILGLRRGGAEQDENTEGDIVPSHYLSGLSKDERAGLTKRLHEIQGGSCFICAGTIDLIVQAESLDVDHVEPLSAGGKDDQTNLALTHASCNRSKQASNLRIARVLARFRRIQDSCQAAEDRGANLSDILREYDGAIHLLTLSVEQSEVRYSFKELGDNAIRTSPIYADKLSGLRYFFAELPIAYLHHDDRINPRNIGGNLAKLVGEFHKGRPQLHVSLGWLATDHGEVAIKVFDGQHKATAQVLLGVTRLPIRVFVDPDPDLLLVANTNAGTTLRQVAFDKSVQRRLGSALFRDRLDRYRQERNLTEDDLSFSERDLVAHFKGDSRDMKRYILDNQRDAVTQGATNKLREFMDYGGKGQEKPLSYSAIEKTFYSFFIDGNLLDTPMDYGQDTDASPRDLEIQQIVELMNVVAEEMFVDQFDPVIGTNRIENRVQKGEQISEPHLRAFRLAKEEILYSWLRYIRQIVQAHFMALGKPIDEHRLFQYQFSNVLWGQIRAYVRSLKGLPVWVNRELSLSVFGGKQNYEFWQTIFETGKSPQGQQVLAEPLNLMTMIQEGPQLAAAAPASLS